MRLFKNIVYSILIPKYNKLCNTKTCLKKNSVVVYKYTSRKSNRLKTNFEDEMYSSSVSLLLSYPDRVIDGKQIHVENN